MSSKLNIIEIYEKRENRRISTFLANRIVQKGNTIRFYLNGDEVYWCDTRECRYRASEYLNKH